MVVRIYIPTRRLEWENVDPGGKRLNPNGCTGFQTTNLRSTSGWNMLFQY